MTELYWFIAFKDKDYLVLFLNFMYIYMNLTIFLLQFFFTNITTELLFNNLVTLKKVLKWKKINTKYP